MNTKNNKPACHQHPFHQSHHLHRGNQNHQLDQHRLRGPGYLFQRYIWIVSMYVYGSPTWELLSFLISIPFWSVKHSIDSIYTIYFSRTWIEHFGTYLGSRDHQYLQFVVRFSIQSLWFFPVAPVDHQDQLDLVDQ